MRVSPIIGRAGGLSGGQQLFTASGTFVVPAGVTSICALAIGPGGPYFDDDGSGNTGSGGGGSLSYRNAIPVTPGWTLTIQITPTTIDPYSEGRAFLLRGSALVGAGGGRIPAPGTPSVVAGSVGFTGGGGAYSTQGAGTMEGGGAGGFTSAGQSANSTRTRRGGGGTPRDGSVLTGALAGASPNLNGQAYGGGAAYGGTPGPGCVLIIWGEGRAFPNTNTGDV